MRKDSAEWSRLLRHRSNRDGNQAFVAGLTMVQSLELGKNRSSKSVLWGLEREQKSVLDTLSFKSLGCPGCWLIYTPVAKVKRRN